MNSVIYNPLEEFESKFREIHAQKTNEFFEKLVKESGVDAELNRRTLKESEECKENVKKLSTKRNWLRFLRVLMCITLVLIPLVVMKTTPKIRELKQQIENADQRAQDLIEKAQQQMLPLNALFTDRDALNLIEETLSLIKFDDNLSAEQEMDMRLNYDFPENNDEEQSVIGVLAGNYNQNPFLFENLLTHRMGTETYHGQLTIHWTERYVDFEGKVRSRSRSETLHASVTKPKPFYSTRLVLNYCAQGAPDLEFTRDAGHLDKKSDKEIERLIKKGEKKLKKMDNKAVKNNDDFMSMSNTEFEVLFDALDRTDEVQYRTLFTPLAQTNMQDLVRSQAGYGDDFDFVKRKRTNMICSEHSQSRRINLTPADYVSHIFDTIKDNFINKNIEFFKAVYFDFAPILAIPVYQERPVHSLNPIPDFSRKYSLEEYEVMANALSLSQSAHPDTKTSAIIKTTFVDTKDETDIIKVKASSYDIEERVDYVSVFGGDGRFHQVPVKWDLYIPLQKESNYCITKDEFAGEKQVLARRDGLCIY